LEPTASKLIALVIGAAVAVLNVLPAFAAGGVVWGT
jgi:hypothetical protein